MKVFLTSSLGCSYKVNGKKIPKKMDNENKVFDQIKSNLDKEDTMIFFVVILVIMKKMITILN